jgi:sulfoxide reductase heme-binding subunit YedZ
MSSPSPLWYATRGSGMIALILLTAVVVLGVLVSTRRATPTWPRFLTQSLHRDLSLLAVAFLALHILTTVLDPYAGIGVQDVAIPFIASYRPYWLGLGVIAAELVVALIVTSLLRATLGFRAWRLVHWLAYISWPIAMLHGAGTGTDTPTWWAMVIYVACASAVIIAVGIRLATATPRLWLVRVACGAAELAGVVAVVIWAINGPLQPGWARAAGTPSNLLAPASAGSSGASETASPSPSNAVPPNIDDFMRGDASQNVDGSTTVTLTDPRSGLVLTLAVPPDGSSIPLTVTANGATVCSTSATYNGQFISAVCGGTDLQLVLSEDDNGGVRGQLTTSSSAASQ